MSMTGSTTSTNLNCLKGKISSLAPYAVDNTLSVEGSAAEAKAVGDALDKKLGFTDIVDDLNTSDSNRVLSANQGVQLKQSFENLRLSTNETLSNMGYDMTVMEDSIKGANNNATSAQTAAKAAQNTAAKKIDPDGSVAMEDDFDMGENKIVNLADPVKDTDAANKGYVDSCIGDKTLSFEVTLNKNSWASTTGEAPYFQTIEKAEITANDKPHYSVVYSESLDTKKAEKEAFALIDDLDTVAGKLTFTCFEERPEVNLTIQLEVNR